jgi:hypothetical protein
MQYDDQQQDIDPSGQGYPLDPFGQESEDQPQRAAGQGLDPLQQQRQRDLGGLGDFGRQAQPGQGDYGQQQGQQGLGDLGDFGRQAQPGQGGYRQQPQQQNQGNLGDFSRQAQADQGDYYSQPGQPDLGDFGQQAQPGLGGIGDMIGNQGGQQASASSDPNNPYGNVDDSPADYGNTQADQSQQGQLD